MITHTKSGLTTSYVYDGDGRRVSKSDSSGTLVFVYNVAGQLIADYTTANPTGSPTTSYLTTDHLGSTRVVTDQNQAVKARHDYLPFGEEIGSNIGGRNGVAGYTASDPTRQRFTGHERDNESGLDFMQARYYSANQGRFTSPDEFTGGPEELYYFAEDASDNPTFYAQLTNPQSLNKYQYCYNNPLKFVDPDGHQGQVLVEKALNSPQGQKILEAVGTAGVAVLAVASGAVTKAWDWLWTPNPNLKVNTQCGNGLDCSQAYTHKSESKNDSAQNDSNAEGVQEGSPQSQQPSQPQKIDSRTQKPKKDQSQQGASQQHKEIESAQATYRKRGQPDRIRSISKSKQNEKTALKRIKNLKDTEEEP